MAPFIFIDEYDTPIQAGYLHGYYQEIVGLFRNFLGAGLKDNPHCFKSVLTGILRVSKESLFSGLNNLAVYSVLHPLYGQYFGFTEAEVRTLLEKTDLKVQSKAIRDWYNGYQIGSHTIYNPWSILNCIKSAGRLKRYWLNTSDNALVKECLYHSGFIHKEAFEELLQGQTVTCFIGTQCQLAIPNIEIRGLYGELIKRWLLGGQKRISTDRFLDELLCGDIPGFEKSFRFLLENTISVHDLSQEPEAFYHGFMTGLTAHLQSHPDYSLKSNELNARFCQKPYFR